MQCTTCCASTRCSRQLQPEQVDVPAHRFEAETNGDYLRILDASLRTVTKEEGEHIMGEDEVGDYGGPVCMPLGSVAVKHHQKTHLDSQGTVGSVACHAWCAGGSACWAARALPVAAFSVGACAAVAEPAPSAMQVFSQLDEKLQQAFVDYLAERGVNEQLGMFIVEYSADKEQREYMGWLEGVHSFLKAK